MRGSQWIELSCLSAFVDSLQQGKVTDVRGPVDSINDKGRTDDI